VPTQTSPAVPELSIEEAVAALSAAIRREAAAPSPIAPTAVSIRTAGAMLGLSRNGVNGALARGDLERVKSGRRVLIPLASIHRLAGGR